MFFVSQSRQLTKGRLAKRAALFYLFAVICLAQNDGLALQSRQAKQLMAEGRFEEAIPVYKGLVRAVPGNPGLILNLGLAQEMAGHPADAVAQFEAVLRSQPDNVPALTSLGTARLQLNQPKLAIAPLQKLVGLQPSDRDARGMLAGCLMATGRFGDAARQYRELTRTDASDAKAWYGLGKAYEELATGTFNQLEKSAPESAYVLTLVADSQASRQQYRSAFFFYKQAAEKKPDLRSLHSGLRLVYEKTGHGNWAQEEQQREESLPKPGCATPSTTRTERATFTAECDFFSGKFLEAAIHGKNAENLFWATKAYNALAFQAFEQLGKLPESVELHALKADILRGHRQYFESANEYRAALKLSPRDRRLQHELAVSLFLAKDYAALIPMLEAELIRNNGSQDTNFMLGDSLLRTQQPDKALPYLESALKSDPSMKPAHASMGLALAMVGRSAEAIQQLEGALAIDDDGSLHYQLARAYQSKGDAARARELMAQYQKILGMNQEHKEEVARQAQITAPGR